MVLRGLFFVNQVTAAEKRLEACLQTEKTAGFLWVIHNEGLQWIELIAAVAWLAVPLPLLNAVIFISVALWMDGRTHLGVCWLVSLSCGVFRSSLGLGMPSFWASRNKLKMEINCKCFMSMEGLSCPVRPALVVSPVGCVWLCCSPARCLHLQQQLPVCSDISERTNYTESSQCVSH